MKIKRIAGQIRQTSGGLFHDSRGDVIRLSQVCNTLISRLNEVIDSHNALYDKVQELEKRK